METHCDGTSVGVILTDETGKVALLRRRRFPVGIAPPAGHVDDHGTPEQAAIAEVAEEIGIALVIDGLKLTTIANRRITNRCRRIGGEYHDWNVYQASVTHMPLQPDPDETGGAGWYDSAAVQALADRTRAYQAGILSEADWTDYPGLEAIWVDFLGELGYIQ
jgi:8-oxo-dGTP pyrophosphatase MutT (NUDIX family)